MNDKEITLCVVYSIPQEEYVGIDESTIKQLNNLIEELEGKIEYEELPKGWILNDLYSGTTKELALIDALIVKANPFDKLNVVYKPPIKQVRSILRQNKKVESILKDLVKN